MIGIEVHDVVVRRIMRLQIIEEHAEIAVGQADAVEALLPVQLVSGDVDARIIRIAAREALAQRQLRLRHRQQVDGLRRPDMHIHRMDLEELVALAERLQLADGPLNAPVRRRVIEIPEDAVIAALHALVHPVGAEHARAVVAEPLHLLGHRHDAGRELDIRIFVENLVVLRVHAGLDGGERRERVLARREVLVEDHALL